MFAPNQADVRRFFCGAYNKHHTNQPLEAIETLAAMWMDLHPEYAGDFADEAGALTTLAAGGDTSAGATESPFLHVSIWARRRAKLAGHLSLRCAVW